MGPKKKPDDVQDPKAMEAIAKVLALFITTAIDKCLTDKTSSLLGRIDELRFQFKKEL